MSKYYLTEAYGDLYNQRLTEASFYDNLRFVDYLQQEEIEEVMESLIWEFMDYGDSLNEAVDTLETVFEDNDILEESLEVLAESTRVGESRMAQRRATRAMQSAESSRTSAEKETNLRNFARRDADIAARSRRAARSAAVRGALSGAKRSVQGALSSVHKQIRDKKAQLKQGISNTREKAKAALARVARGGRRVMNAVKGGVAGAKAGFNEPVETPQRPKLTRSQYELRKNIRAVNAKLAVGQPFSNSGSQTTAPKAPAKTRIFGSAKTRERMAKNKEAYEEAKRKLNSSVPKAPAKTRIFGSAKTRERMAKNKEAYEEAKRKLNSSVDYDLLTQYMIEDLIDEGYATSEDHAFTILENMTEENLNEFASLYLQD